MMNHDNTKKIETTAELNELYEQVMSDLGYDVAQFSGETYAETAVRMRSQEFDYNEELADLLDEMDACWHELEA